MRGFICKQRYACATICLDHFSDHTYTHLQRSTSLQDTLAAFRAYENFCDRHGVKVRHYHADNGRFVDQGFLDSLAKDQTISFCGAYAHWQNGKAEKRIRDLQDQGRKVLIYSNARWPQASTIHLWPYALHYSTDVRNHIPRDESGLSPM